MGAMLKGPLPLDDFSEYPQVQNPLLAADAATKSFLPIDVRIDLSDFRFGNMSWGSADGHMDLASSGNLSSMISRKGFQTGDLLSAFVKPGGFQIGRRDRLSPDFCLKEELLSGRVKVLTKTDCLEWHNKEASRRKSYFYNTFSR